MSRLNIPEIHINNNRHLTIDKFRELDYLSVNKYKIPIELMMENAGLQLARLVASVKTSSANILLGIGIGNNGGGGLVAARRLASWGYSVFLEIPDTNLHALPQVQLERAIACGAKAGSIEQPDIYVDAYLGFSQRSPLPDTLMMAIDYANSLNCPKISLDLPTGFDKVTGVSLFKPDTILTLAAMKTELIPLLYTTRIYIADLGLPTEVYKLFGIEQPPVFSQSGIVKCIANGQANMN